MASSPINDEKKLVDIFEEGYALFNRINVCEEPTNSVGIQAKVKTAMRLFEEATRLTSMAAIFSNNEGVEEVATENLRLFLLPALLGMLALKITGSTNRMEIVETSDTYFRDFLQRCNDYGVSQITIPPPLEIDEEKLAIMASRPTNCPFDIVSAARNRAAKIQRYKEEKALEIELKELSEAIKSPNVDEDVKREYYLKLIKSYVAKAEEELDCLQSEKMILAHMKNVGKNDSLANIEESKRRVKPSPKLTPVIITKDVIQKAVFGAGYPSLPTMTVQEFYDKRVREGIFPQCGTTTLQDIANKSEDNQKASEKLHEKDEKEDEKVKDEEESEEKLEEDDDSDLLKRRRAMDEYRDDHKRGWGNRYNRS